MGGYRVVQTFEKSAQGEEKILYGVACDTAAVTGFTARVEEAEQLAELFNKEELDPIHLSEVVRDYLCDPQLFMRGLAEREDTSS